MTSQEIFQNFLNDIKAHIEKFESAPLMAFYRGCNIGKYELVPSLFRNRDKLKYNWSTDSLENNLYYDFTSVTNSMIDDEKDWHILYKMQHHNVPTRLLDWTESIGVALYFALEYNNIINKPCIWVLDPFALNNFKEKTVFAKMQYLTLYNPIKDFDFSYYDGFINWNNSDKVFIKPKALYPIKSNDRIKAQKGVFTVHGKDEKCFTKICKGVVKKFTIPQKAILPAKEFLKDAGINHFSMFPDLEGLSRQMKSEYYYNK